MWMNGSSRQSDRPASRTRTLVDGSAESRFASAHPAEPPPTMITSYRVPAIDPLVVALPPAGDASSAAVQRRRSGAMAPPATGVVTGTAWLRRVHARSQASAMPPPMTAAIPLNSAAVDAPAVDAIH